MQKIKLITIILILIFTNKSFSYDYSFKNKNYEIKLDFENGNIKNLKFIYFNGDQKNFGLIDYNKNDINISISTNQISFDQFKKIFPKPQKNQKLKRIDPKTYTANPKSKKHVKFCFRWFSYDFPS